MIRKGFSKGKLVLDELHFLMKRGKVVGKEALNEASLSCRSRDVHLSFVSPMEYEFSCRTSPSHQPYVPLHRRKQKSGRYRYYAARSRTLDGVGFGGCRDAGDYESPLPKALAIPKGRRGKKISRESPLVVLKDDDDEYRVDEAAEEFIQSFYTQLRLQKWLAVMDAADYYG
ncbi:putative Polyketide cyclase/dehydrase and lipid transport superfamily protein [Hibiscus syriacus]|uniref:Polyketide cyclase/dehydrase and lipid transport superfamily protein n=2 Tax=Hibiscus syriacus TaxID=106335 RepID=A0A6A2Y322_HIBSY|nr:putative Polyketide cyclase/dehydrase and lipid transport superfamily protein [Hibiscus syriacus]